MENNNWMIVRKEKLSTKIKNYFKNIFSKVLNQNKKKKKNKGIWPKKEPVQVIKKEQVEPLFERKNTQKVEAGVDSKNNVTRAQNKQITIEVAPTKRKPKEIVIEYENKNKKKSKEIVVEYHNNKKQNVITVNENKSNQKQSKKANQKTVREVKVDKEKVQPIKKEAVNKEKIKLETKKINLEKTELALKPIKEKVKKERKPFNIFQLFKEKERKKRKEILNRIRENKVDDYETISTKTKLSRGSIVVDDIDANELDPLIDLYRDSNKKLRNRIRESQMQ